MHIRRADEDDAALIAELNTVVQSLHHAVRPDVFRPPDAAGAVEEFRRRLCDADTFVYIVEAPGGHVAGYVLARRFRVPDNPFTRPALVVELDQIAVRPDFRRAGVGRALVERVVELARDVRADRVDLSVWDFNDAAREFFARCGFAAMTERRSLRL